MIRKQNLWFLTLFSLILVMGVYYFTMPGEIVVNKEEENITPTIEIIENEYLTALKQEKEEERKNLKKEYENKLNSSTSTSEEKNNAYLGIKGLNELKEEEENLEEKIKKEFELDSYIKIKEDEITVVVAHDKHDTKLANNIMRFIQSLYDKRKVISISFKA